MSDSDNTPVFCIPRKNDRLFRSDSDWQTNACVNYSHRPNNLYSDGYRAGARFLAEKVCESGRGQDYLVYPIVYLYRHYCELALKNIFHIASELLDREQTDQEVDALGKHNLNKLWKNLSPLLNSVCELVGNDPFPVDDMKYIESNIQQLDEHDPDGQRFRYATVKSRKKKSGVRDTRESLSLKPDLKLINIRVFADSMETLADHLDSIEGWFGDLLEEKHEMERAVF